MTTIVYDRITGELASDSQDTDGGMKRSCKKLFKVGPLLIATAGGSYAGLVFVRWMESQRDPLNPNWDDTPDLSNLSEEEDFECIVVHPDRSYYTVNKLFVPYEHDDEGCCMGSGAKVAAGALHAGASVKEAVRIACKVDAYTSGRVQYMKVK